MIERYAKAKKTGSSSSSSKKEKQMNYPLPTIEALHKHINEWIKNCKSMLRCSIKEKDYLSAAHWQTLIRAYQNVLEYNEGLQLTELKIGHLCYTRDGRICGNGIIIGVEQVNQGGYSIGVKSEFGRISYMTEQSFWQRYYCPERVMSISEWDAQYE